MESRDNDSIRSRLLAMMLGPTADTEHARRRTLRTALRWWRGTLDPARTELPVRARRHPGLTCAEVAERAGMSLCWYALLEGASTEHTCSPRTIDRVADALLLEEIDRAILHALAGPQTFRSLRVLLANDPEHTAQPAANAGLFGGNGCGAVQRWLNISEEKTAS